MSSQQAIQTGVFCWAELATPNLDAVQPFYAQLFHWNPTPSPDPNGDPYTFCQSGEDTIAGMYAFQPGEAGQYPRWDSYIAVADAQHAVNVARVTGGTILTEPTEVMNMGTMAAIQDPGGAVIRVWQPHKPEPIPAAGAPGTIVWNELATRNTQACTEFYTEVFGWKAEYTEDPMPYTVFWKDDVRAAGMMEMGDNFPKEVPAHWMPYFAADDVDHLQTLAKSLDGEIVVPAQDVPTVGRFAVLQDPGGATFSVIKFSEA
ncbi:VOC family protein [Pontibacter sp. G13]|uniref:VOC family protein n=1 Tax=Pontibacter sp. G13 TaxID=3074898 RepID=UPI00288A74B3|nr:VOC family protein [Pontibacter sp. G13]WNJ20513.1 VOC family protein [Pontibacter sp. G13]